MVTLGISTSSEVYGLILYQESMVILTKKIIKTTNNEDIAKIFVESLSEAKINIKEISKIIVDTGPGGTSRTRTGIAFANSLSYSLRRPIYPVSSIELAGIRAWSGNHKSILVVIKSIKGNAFVGLFERGQAFSLTYGNMLDCIQKFLKNGEFYGIVGYNRDKIISMFPDITIEDCGELNCDIEGITQLEDLYLERSLNFPKFALAITDSNLEI